MPADVSFPHVSTPVAAPARSGRRLPLGLGLTIGAGVSIGLWVGVAAAVRALFF